MMIGTIAAVLLADLSGACGMNGHGLGVVMADEGDGGYEEDVFEYTIAYSKAKLDNYCTNLKTIYIFTVENTAKLNAICNDANRFLDSNPGMESAERHS